MTAEEMVIRRACAGDPEAFDFLVTPYLPRAQRIAYLITHDRDSAADAVQEALVRTYRSLRNVKPGGQFRPWFTRIVVNEAIKQAKRKMKLFQPLVEQVRGLVGWAVAPESAVEAREEHEYVWSAIQRLSSIHRVVIVLRYYEEFTESEMATILGVPPGTVKSRLYHARKALEQMLPESAASNSVKHCLDGGDLS